MGTAFSHFVQKLIRHHVTHSELARYTLPPVFVLHVQYCRVDVEILFCDVAITQLQGLDLKRECDALHKSFRFVIAMYSLTLVPALA